MSYDKQNKSFVKDFVFQKKIIFQKCGLIIPKQRQRDTIYIRDIIKCVVENTSISINLQRLFKEMNTK